MISQPHRQLCGWNSTQHSEARKTLVSWNPVIFPGWCPPLTCLWTPNTHIQTCPHSLYFQNLAVNLAELHKCWVSQWLNVNYTKARKQRSSKKEFAFKVIFKIKNSNFEISTCFHEVVTNNTENPWTLYPISLGDNTWPNYNKISEPGNWHWHKGQNAPITARSPQAAFSQPHAPPSPSTSNTHGTSKSVLHFHSTRILRMLQKWNHTGLNLLGLDLFTQLNSLETHAGCRVYTLCSISLLTGIHSINVYTSVCLTIHPLTDIWVVSGVWLSIKSCYEHLHTDFYVNMFAFLWNTCPSTQLLGCMVVACLVLQETATLFPRVTVPFTFCQPCMSDVHSPHLHWHLRLSLLFILAILIGV